MENAFSWKGGTKAAVSLSFDDARVTQVDYGLAIFAAYEAKATFYVSPAGLEERPEGWEIAVDRGHEIGNHTYNHPCSGNFDFARDNPLEDYTLQRMSEEIDKSNNLIKETLGVEPTTFAYPCGQTYVGRGELSSSYVPLIANRFLAGRGYLSESTNDPVQCDLARLNASASDNLTAEPLIKQIEKAVAVGGWLIFAGHEISNPKNHQNTKAGALRAILAYMRQNSDDIWLGTVAEVAAYIQESRLEKEDV